MFSEFSSVFRLLCVIIVPQLSLSRPVTTPNYLGSRWQVDKKFWEENPTGVLYSTWIPIVVTFFGSENFERSEEYFEYDRDGIYSALAGPYETPLFKGTYGRERQFHEFLAQLDVNLPSRFSHLIRLRVRDDSSNHNNTQLPNLESGNRSESNNLLAQRAKHTVITTCHQFYFQSLCEKYKQWMKNDIFFDLFISTDSPFRAVVLHVSIPDPRAVLYRTKDIKETKVCGSYVGLLAGKNQLVHFIRSSQRCAPRLDKPMCMIGPRVVDECPTDSFKISLRNLPTTSPFISFDVCLGYCNPAKIFTFLILIVVIFACVCVCKKM